MKEERLLRQISKFYNRCNHFGMFQPTCGTNVIGASYVLEKLWQPPPWKEATTLGRRVKKRRLKKNLDNEKNWKVYKFHIPCVASCEYTIQLKLSNSNNWYWAIVIWSCKYSSMRWRRNSPALRWMPSARTWDRLLQSPAWLMKLLISKRRSSQSLQTILPSSCETRWSWCTLRANSLIRSATM